jgi:hypothetical protein
MGNLTAVTVNISEYEQARETLPLSGNIRLLWWNNHGSTSTKTLAMPLDSIAADQITARSICRFNDLDSGKTGRMGLHSKPIVEKPQASNVLTAFPVLKFWWSRLDEPCLFRSLPVALWPQGALIDRLKA